VIGGCGGGAFGLLGHHFVPQLVPHPESFFILGMAGFFSAAAKTPFSTIVIVSEMTGDYKMILPALWVCVIAYLLSDEQSLYRSQVSRRSASPAHQGSFVREVLAGLTVQQFLQSGTAFTSLKPQDRVATVVDRLARSPYPVLPVVDEEGRLLGVVNIEEVHLASRTEHARQLLVAADLMRSHVTPLKPEHHLDEALELFVENDLMALPVVADDKSRQVLGIVRRYDIAQGYLLRVHGKEPIEAPPS
jgi:CIC family chloride channel protein